MKIIKLSLFISSVILSALFLTSCSDDAEEAGLDTSVSYEEISVSYGSDPLQNYDIFLPANRTESETHVVIMVHGGGWVGGDKADVEGLVDVLKLKMPNFAVVNMNYRLTADVSKPFEDQLADVGLAIKELDIQSNFYQISDSYALVGVSAGGHMSLQHSYTANDQDKIKVVGNIIGPTYFLDPAYTMATELTYQVVAQVMEDFTGQPYTNSSFYEGLSPYNAVNANTIPTIQFFGDSDPLIPNSQGPLLKSKLDEFGIPNELTIYEGEGHGWSKPENWDDTAEKFKNFVLRFIDQ